jgi:putative ABC transport system ATP-binding protein
MPSVVARGLSYTYPDGGTVRAALSDIDLVVEAGEILFLTGPSGCGKTTLLTLVGALRSVQSGTLDVLGHPLHKAEEAGRVASRRRTGFVFQHHNLHRSLTALGNVMIGLEARGQSRRSDAEALCRDALAAVGLSGLEDRRQDQLSGGQRQRVAVARAMVGGPALLLADEPTGALDGRTGAEVMEGIHRLARRQGTTVIVVTHDPRLDAFADRIVAMEDGRMRSAVPPAPPARGSAMGPALVTRANALTLCANLLSLSLAPPARADADLPLPAAVAVLADGRPWVARRAGGAETRLTLRPDGTGRIEGPASRDVSWATQGEDICIAFGFPMGRHCIRLRRNGAGLAAYEAGQLAFTLDRS